MPRQNQSKGWTPRKLNDPGWDEVFDHAGQLYDVDPLVLKAMMFTESGPDTAPEARISIYSKDANGNPIAHGPMQFVPSTARLYAVDPSDPWEAIHGAAKYLSDNLKTYNGDLRKALLQYNGGNNPAKWNQGYADTVAGYYGQLLNPPPLELTVAQSEPARITPSQAAKANAADPETGQHLPVMPTDYIFGKGVPIPPGAGTVNKLLDPLPNGLLPPNVSDESGQLYLPPERFPEERADVITRLKERGR